jgi:F0F1-type ATP synthase membrane subunit a
VKGIASFLLFIGVVAIGCGVIPFVVMPNNNIAPALPVIYVPGEHLESLGHFPGTNVQITNTMVAAWITMVFVWLWIIPIALGYKDVPSRAQGIVESIVELWQGFARSAAGPKGKQLMPMILSIFTFLLVANLMKIVPGVDTIGELHCAGLTPGVESDEATEEDYQNFNGYDIKRLGSIGIPVYGLQNPETFNTGTTIPFKQYKDCKETLHAHAETLELAEREALDAEASKPSEGKSEHGEEPAPEGTPEAESTPSSSLLLTATEEDGGPPPPSAEGGEEHGRKFGTLAVNDRYVVTPFVRGATTDLSMTLAIAIVAMLVVQYIGVKELGVGYFGKFINVQGLARGGMGYIDFAVGVLETFLELMKVVSFAFRLFGAMFGGQVLMFVIVFLVGTIAPILVIGLEVFIGLIQAFVFSILFLMFSVVAMTSHHHDEEHAEEHH